MALISLAGYSETEQQFMIAVGRVLTEWSYIENSLFGIFEHITKLEEIVARAIFYSARSYNARADMLKAIIPVCQNKNERDAFRVILCKANNYKGFRNKLAHNIPITNATEAGAEILFVEGKKRHFEQLSIGTKIKDLNNAFINFNHLAHNADLIRGYIQKGYLERLPACLEQLRMLPNEPDQSEPSRNQKGRQYQRQSVPAKAASKPKNP